MQQTSRDREVKKLYHIKHLPIIKAYLEEADFLKKARTDAESLKIPIVDDETGRFLELACYLLKPAKILEIGCGTGYSTYFLLKSILPGLIANLPAGSRDRAWDSAKGGYATQESSADMDKAAESATGLRDKTLESSGGIDKAGESASDEAGNLKIHFSYTGIDLNRERLDQACLFISSLINRTIRPCRDGKRMNTVIEYESLQCSFEFIHGNAIKVIREEKETEEKYDLVFIDNIFYSGKIFREEILKHDSNSIAGLTEYLDVVTGTVVFETSLFNIGDGIALSIYNKGK
jgi:predicted O-methyltransferase YrrM